MAHSSEKAFRLQIRIRRVSDLCELAGGNGSPAVHFYWLPANRTDADACASQTELNAMLVHATALDEDSLVCILTTPPEAARLVSRLPHALHYQIWVAVKITVDASTDKDELKNQHAALLILSRYSGSLRHTKTRVPYTFCPACGKTTKDYGGKKHTYHQYGTLLSDVWRDLDCDPSNSIAPIFERLRDLFGLHPHRDLVVHDLRQCEELKPKPKLESTATKDRIKAPGNSRTAKLVNADCLAALRAMPPDSVDYCFADPPYNIKKKYDRWDDGLDIQQYFSWCDQWVDELCRVVRPGCSVALVNIPLWCVRHFEHLVRSAHGMRFQHWIAWDGLSLPVRLIMPSHYGILTFSKGDPRLLPGLSRISGEDQMSDDALSPHPEFYCLRASCQTEHRFTRSSADRTFSDLWHDIHRLKHNSKRVDHPCQLPPMLMRRLIGLYTSKGETVLDPFNGAGTTTLVARQMRRDAIGIELSPDYHRIAELRHADLESGFDPFGRNGDVPKAKNSRVERLPKRQYAVPKKVLQLEVRHIAKRLGRLPTREEVATLSAHPIEYFDQYFVSWGEVCAAARNGGMSELPMGRDQAEPALFEV